MESSQNYKLKKRSTKNLVEERRKHLITILEHIQNEHLTPNENTIIKKIREKYPSYTRNQLFMDRTALNLQNNYIRYFLPNYSAYQEQINKTLQYIAEQAELNYNKEWKVKKTTVRTIVAGKNKKKIVEQTIESEMPYAKAIFLNILNKATKLMQEHSQGSNIHLGALALQQELKAKEDEIKLLKKSQDSTNLPVIQNA